MSAGDGITQDWQVELLELVHGGSTDLVIREFEPWSAPVVRSASINRPQRDGVIPGVPYRGSRLIPLKLWIDTPTEAQDRILRRTLAATWALGSDVVELVWQEDGVTYRVYGQPQEADSKLTPRIPTDCLFEATDPFIYANDEQHDDSGWPTPTDFYDEEYGGYVDPLTNGRLLFTNAGTAGAPWRLDIEGPWVNPRIQLFDPSVEPYPPVIGLIPLTLTLDDGEVLSIDSRQEAVWIDDALRLDVAAQIVDWFTVPPGDWALRVTGVSGSGSVDAWVRSAWA